MLAEQRLRSGVPLADRLFSKTSAGPAPWTLAGGKALSKSRKQTANAIEAMLDKRLATAAPASTAMTPAKRPGILSRLFRKKNPWEGAERVVREDAALKPAARRARQKDIENMLDRRMFAWENSRVGMGQM